MFLQKKYQTSGTYMKLTLTYYICYIYIYILLVYVYIYLCVNLTHRTKTIPPSPSNPSAFQKTRSIFTRSHPTSLQGHQVSTTLRIFTRSLSKFKSKNLCSTQSMAKSILQVRERCEDDQQNDVVSEHVDWL